MSWTELKGKVKTAAVIQRGGIFYINCEAMALVDEGKPLSVSVYTDDKRVGLKFMENGEGTCALTVTEGKLGKRATFSNSRLADWIKSDNRFWPVIKEKDMIVFDATIREA